MTDLFSHTEPTVLHSLTEAEQVARLQLIRTDNVGPVTFRHLLNRYGSAEKALQVIPALAAKGGRKKPLKIPLLSHINQEIEAIQKLGAEILHIGSDAYPARLATLEDAPPVLFIKGHAALLSRHIIGVVGARNASAAGIKISRDISATLSEQKIVIASGLARGIDTAAHAASLQGGTIACLAGGLDIIYPRENEALHDKIANVGVLVSEMPLSTKPQARHFPRRNRLISGLSLGILVIEAAEKSGSLITARYAADQGREVFAIPGSPLDPRSKGTNTLIKDGAILTQSAEDILAEIADLKRTPFTEPDDLPLFDALKTAPSYEPDDNDRATILSLISHTPMTINTLIRHSDIAAGTVLAIILELELAATIMRYPGNKVALIN